ncbi:ShlB/FhaC/HecB family hemolysin secretion/activation protein [Novosphingobium album (ex Liu et al. 2023)]|nr:ShlB/FhaC/HecB family hemolysin secretion/activation protein [Novosphingobium album (ex Liu et al. 2023)]
MPPAGARAQEAPVPPTREELTAGKDAANPTVARPRLIVQDDGIERGPCPLADPAFAQTRVTFSSVTFANLRAVPPAALDDTWSDLAGREVPVAALCEVRDRAATALRAMGYLAAVQIPPQRIGKSGTVRMDVLIARLTEVQVRGKAGPSEKLIAAHLARLTREEWFNVNRAERHLLLLGDLPGYSVRLVLRPARGAPGDVTGDVLVERRPLELAVGVQNLGPRANGREGGFAQLILNGVTGLGDQTLFSLFNTAQFDEQTVVQVGHEFALGPDGLRLGGRLLYGTGKPELPGGDFKTETVLGNLELSYPLVRRQSRSITLAGGLDVIDQSVDLGAIRVSQDKLRVVYARLTADAIDRRSLTGYRGYTPNEPRWRAGMAIELRQGIGALGASGDCAPIAACLAPHVPISNFFGDPTAFVIRGEGYLEYRPHPVVTLAVSPRIQYSDASLLNFEQYSLGNYTVGRGYDPGAVLGDSGAGAGFELRYGRGTPHSPDAVALQPFVFLDAARAWSHDRAPGEDSFSLYSAGGGLRARWGDHLDANLMLAVPLKRAPLRATRGDVRILFNVRARLVPWRPE